MLSLSRGHMSLFNTLSEITDYLFLSGSGALKKEKILGKQITCIVNVTTEEPNAYINGVDYVKIRVEDHPFSRLDTYFDMVADRIHQNRKNGERTLVHCVAGVSRSASLCIVYLMKYDNMTLREAYQHVKAIRPIIRPNSGFWKQMIDFERRIKHGRSSVKMIPVGRGDADEDKLPDVYVEEIRHRQSMQREVSAWDRSIQLSKAGVLGGVMVLNQQNGRASSVGALGNGRRSVFSSHGHANSLGGLSSATRSPTRSQLINGTSGSSSRFGSSRLGSSTHRSNTYTSMYSPRQYASVTSNRQHYTSIMTPSKRSSQKHDGNLFSNLYNSTAELFYPGL